METLHSRPANNALYYLLTFFGKIWMHRKPNIFRVDLSHRICLSFLWCLYLIFLSFSFSSSILSRPYIKTFPLYLFCFPRPPHVHLLNNQKKKHKNQRVTVSCADLGPVQVGLIQHERPVAASHLGSDRPSVYHHRCGH